LSATVEETRRDKLLLLDRPYYERQTGEAFPDDDSALRHYAEVGARQLLDPSPYFDTEFYFAQAPDLLAHGSDPLEHYAREAPQNGAYRPNPLFGNGFYLELNPAVQAVDANPLLHYLEEGARRGSPASPRHAQILQACGLGTQRVLFRGRPTAQLAFFVGGGWQPELLIAFRDAVLDDGLALLFIFGVGSSVPERLLGEAGVVDLGEFGSSEELARPSAVRLLARSIGARQPRAVFTELQDAVLPTYQCGVPVYAILPDARETATWSEVEWLADLVERLIIPSSDWFHRLGRGRDTYPTNIALRTFSPGEEPGSETDPSSAHSFAGSILDLARRNGKLYSEAVRPVSPSSTRRIVVVCSDWGLSGVNSAIEAVGKELRAREWDLELLFTRDAAFVEESAGSRKCLPDLPHRYLDRGGGVGVEAMWQRLIAELNDAAPCIVLIAYDFFGNSVVPALSNDLGVVMWAQADDGDYYEQAYRLGRYCNAIVCVSSRIREQVASIHPGIGERAHVVHNTSVAEADVLPRNRRRSEKLRIVYTGRLVQYQKRVLDFVALADELEALGLDFAIDLVGDAPPAHDRAAELLPRRAARHVERGSMRVLGRLSRAEVLDELRASDFFVLVSDFEGLPLSLIEAMAAGCVPVIAAMESGISEVLVPGENGVIVEGRDYAHWARTIQDLWLDEARLTAIAERAQQTVRASFTVERITDQLEALFSAVAEEIANGYERPPALTWGPRRAPFGDVLPPPPMYRAVPVAGLG
jgi:glycosyltransferase involved in cell wall biosynthesis